MMTNRRVRVMSKASPGTVLLEGLAIAEGMDGHVLVREDSGTQSWWSKDHVELADRIGGGRP